MLQRAEPLILVRLISLLAQTNSIYYLHPSFGYYFEFFYPEPHGLVYKLTAYPTNQLLAPLPGKDLIAENEAFWAKADAQALKPLLAVVSPPAPGNKSASSRVWRRKPISRESTVMPSPWRVITRASTTGASRCRRAAS
jgi:hypothetical protein